MAFNDHIAVDLTDREKLLLESVQLAYRKHWMNDESIGWSELGDTLANNLAEVMGDKDFCTWLEKIRFEITFPTLPRSERGS